MIDIVLSLFFFIATIVGFATSFIVLFSKKKYSKNFFLGLFLFSLAVVSVYNFCLSASGFKNFPDLFIIAKSFIFLVAPSAFLYVRNILFSDRLFRRYDWLHFLPFVIYFSLTLVVWIGNFTNLRIANSISDTINNPFSMLSLTIWLFYAFCQTMMILNYDLKKFKENHFNKRKILGWIRVYNLMILFLFSALFVHYFLVSHVNTIDFSCYILISSVLIFTVSWLYFKPQIFYDLNDVYDFKEETISDLNTNENKAVLPLIKELTSDKKVLYLDTLESIFATKSSF